MSIKHLKRPTGRSALTHAPNDSPVTSATTDAVGLVPHRIASAAATADEVQPVDLGFAAVR